MISGDDIIVFIEVQGLYLPIGCLTDNSLNDEISEMAVTRADGGWSYSVPIGISYSIGFSGVMPVDGGNKVTHEDLRNLKRGRSLIQFKLENTATGFRTLGQGYITELGSAFPVGDFATFTGAIEGIGKPVFNQKDEILWDSSQYTLDSGTITFDQRFE